MTKKFEDAKGRAWAVEITSGVYLRIISENGIDLNSFAVSRKASDEEKQSTVERFFEFLYDPEVFPKVMLTILAEQMKAASIDRDEFLNSFGTQSVEKAIEAFKEALADFFQNPLTKTIFLKGTQGVMAMQKAAVTRVTKAADMEIARAVQAMEKEIDQALKNSSTRLLASQE